VIPDDIVERVREEADIVSVVGEYVKLKRVGTSFRGPCPFHHGKDPNFSVTLKGGYKCFVCGESGDVFTFVQKHLGLDFVEAVKFVGGKVGVEVREVSRAAERDTREPFWEINGSAAAFFSTQLWDAEWGATAREYLASRGIDRAAADRFSLGYAPRDPVALRSYLGGLGFEDERQIAAGLLVRREERPEPAPRFRDRVIFPIYDIGGHVVGFGGRALGDGKPKYLNSAESEVFSKGQLLYGLNWAKQAVRKADRLIVVEGYFDAIRLILAGIGEVVAPLGTALTEAQAALIRRYTRNVFLLYDSDQAGLRATFRSGDALLATGVSVRVITLPDGEDPDTFVAKAGADGFERAAGASVDVFDRKVQILERSGWFADLRRKRQALDKLLPTIRVTSDALLRDLYVARTSEAAGVSREMLEREIAAGTPSGARGARRVEADDPSPASFPIDAAPVRRTERRRDHRGLGVRAERELVRMLLHQRMYIESIGERVGADVFVDYVYRSIFAALVTLGPETSVEQLAQGLDQEATEVLQELLADSGGLERSDEVVGGSVNALLSRDLADRLGEIDRLLPLANDGEKDDLIREKTRLAGEMQVLGRPRWKSFGRTRP
jgi:DNA primase